MFSIGVNDMYVETFPYNFESVLRELMVIAEFNKKNVIMHSYLRFFSENYYAYHCQQDGSNNCFYPFF